MELNVLKVLDKFSNVAPQSTSTPPREKEASADTDERQESAEPCGANGIGETELQRELIQLPEQHEGIPVPSETNTTTGTAPASSSTSCTESLCRICQLARRESGEALRSSECSCRGSLSRIHKSCLTEWVRYKGSNNCEICQNQFRGISPPRRPGILQVEALQQLRNELHRNRPFSRRKRAMLAAMVVFLLVVTCVTALLTISAEREFQRMSKNPWISKKKIENTNIIFSVCVGVSFFCATTTLGLVFIWLGMECCFAIHRRNVLRRAASFLLINEQQL